jgi:hypothetical protein
MIAALALAVSIDPQQIFYRAFARLESYPLAPYAIWIDTWLTKQTDAHKGGEPVSAIVQERYAVRSSDGAENHTLFPVTGTSLPPARVGRQFIGPFAFLIRRNRTRRDEPASMQADIPEPLKVIANVVAYPKPVYAIATDTGNSNAGVSGVPIETIAGHKVYHLQLRALADGRKHNLRDLWVDAETFDVWKIHFTSEYAPDQLLSESATDVTVWFTPVGKFWVASRAVWNWEDYADGLAFDYDASTERIAFPDDLPGWIFDQRAYDAHVNAKDPDILAPILAGSQNP